MNALSHKGAPHSRWPALKALLLQALVLLVVAVAAASVRCALECTECRSALWRARRRLVVVRGLRRWWLPLQLLFAPGAAARGTL